MLSFIRHASQKESQGFISPAHAGGFLKYQGGNSHPDLLIIFLYLIIRFLFAIVKWDELKTNIEYDTPSTNSNEVY